MVMRGRRVKVHRQEETGAFRELHTFHLAHPPGELAWRDWAAEAAMHRYHRMAILCLAWDGGSASLRAPPPNSAISSAVTQSKRGALER